MPSLTTEKVIDAPPDAVWAVLADPTTYAQWNDVLLGLAGPLEVGATCRLRLDAGLRMVDEDVVLAEVEPGRALSWTGQLGGPWLLHLHHGFHLRPEGSGTHVTHFEHFTGLLGRPTVWVVGRRLAAQYDRLDLDLARRVAAQAG